MGANVTSGAALSIEGVTLPIKILFAGTPVKSDLPGAKGKTTEEVIRETAAKWPLGLVDLEVITRIGSKEAMTKFRKEGCVCS